ncbi:MAG: peptide/nickel transport system permease protein [Pseudonocardiales bacterium]|jgi:peptide/nickel transport system permease protein|nr:peptide/nickel transport system permease protein [Pseudonocardiales bacterium]
MTLPQQGDIEVVGSFGLIQTEEPSQKAIEGRSLGRIAWNRLKHDKVAIAGGFTVIFFVLVAVFAGPLCHLIGQSATAQHQNLTDPTTTMPLGSFGGMTGKHLLGITPISGNDILAQLIYGARTSLIIAGLATALSLLFGIGAGLIAGYFRGWSDSVISRTMDLLLSFPSLLFSIALLTVFSIVPSFLGLSGQPLRFAVIIFVLGFFGFPYIGRIVRGQVLSLREKEFVDAARSLGASNYRIMSREILPNLLGPILVYTTLTIPNYILGEAGLSYLGVGVLPPTVSWGGMLSDAGQFYQVDPAYLFIPGLAIFITVLAFNLFGDGLRDAFDPKSTR